MYLVDFKVKWLLPSWPNFAYFMGLQLMPIVSIYHMKTDTTQSFLLYWAIQRSWFARVNALCNLSQKKSREVAVHFRADFWVGVASRCV